MFTVEIQSSCNYEDADEIADAGDTFNQEQVAAEKKFYKSLLDCSDYTRRRRILKLLKFLEVQASRNRVTLNELLGMVTKQGNYVTDRRTFQIGVELQKGRNTTELTLPQCSYLIFELDVTYNV